MENQDVKEPEGAQENQGERVQEGELGERDLTAELDALRNDLLRAMAETENVRKRAAKEREDAERYALSSFARALTGVAENLSRALASVPEESLEQTDSSLKALVQGVRLTEAELLGIFSRQGIEKINPLGQKFDPHLHQAMMEVEDPVQSPGHVINVLQAGYKIHDRVLTPALVVVSKAPAS